MGHALSRELTAPGHHVDLMNSAFHSLGPSVLRQHRLDTGSPRLLMLSSGMLEAEIQEPSRLGIYNYGVAISTPHPLPLIAELRCQRTLSNRPSVQTGKPRPMSNSPKVNAKTALQASHFLPPPIPRLCLYTMLFKLDSRGHWGTLPG